jgi:hypothetical protein
MRSIALTAILLATGACGSESHRIGRWSCPDPGSVMVNEIDYDQGDEPDAAEFIELLNVTGASVILDGHELLLVHGGELPLREMPYGRASLSGVLGDGEYALVTAPPAPGGMFAVPAPPGVPHFLIEGAETTDRLADGSAAVVVLVAPNREAGPAAGIAYEGTLLYVDRGGTAPDGGSTRFTAQSIGPDGGTDPGPSASLARVPDGCFFGGEMFSVATPTPGRPND